MVMVGLLAGQDVVLLLLHRNKEADLLVYPDKEVVDLRSCPEEQAGNLAD